MKSRRNTIIALSVTTVIGLVIWVSMLILTWGIDKPNALLVEMGKTGASLSLITAIGSIIQWILKDRDLVMQRILKDRDAEKQKEKETLDFYRNVLSDFKSVYD